MWKVQQTIAAYLLRINVSDIVSCFRSPFQRTFRISCTCGGAIKHCMWCSRDTLELYSHYIFMCSGQPSIRYNAINLHLSWNERAINELDVRHDPRTYFAQLM